jgi:hypothetical protein
MFYSTTDGQYINEGQAFTIGGIQYPANWLNLSTPEEKLAIGLEEVIATNQPANDQYYWVSSTLDKATLTYTNTPKDLDQVKINSASQINATAYSLLFPSDWMVVKATETSTPINPDWNTYRANVRATADQNRTAVTLAVDVDAVASIMASIVWPKSPNEVTKEVAEVVVDVPQVTAETVEVAVEAPVVTVETAQTTQTEVVNEQL